MFHWPLPVLLHRHHSRVWAPMPEPEAEPDYATLDMLFDWASDAGAKVMGGHNHSTGFYYVRVRLPEGWREWSGGSWEQAARLAMDDIEPEHEEKAA